MPEETPQLPVSPQETQIQAPLRSSEATSEGGEFKEKISAQKKKILIGLGAFFGVLVFAGAAFGIYKYAQRQIPIEPTEGPTPTLIATPTPDPTADWETYTNEEYGYLIKYPPGTEIVEGPGGEGKILGTDFLFSGPNEESWVYDGFNISISIVKNPNNKKPKEFTQEVYNSSIKQIQTPGFPAEGDIADCKVEEITRGEVDGSRFTYCIFAPGGGILAFSDWFIHNGNTIEIHARLANEPHREIFSLMLSTFKFLEEEVPQSISIPNDWQEYTATDPDFGIKTTLSLPPGYSFRFTGSEFTIQNDTDATELWDYASSVFKGWSPTCDKNTIKFEDVSRCCLNDTRNYYLGESRRVWYERFLNGDFSCNYPAYDAKIGTILNVNEQTIGNSSYLEVTVDTKSSEKNETHFLYVQNNILHIIRPVSYKANSAEAQIPKNIGLIFYSLNSSLTK